MKTLSDKNKSKMHDRVTAHAVRTLNSESNLVDFSSNDYIGFSKSIAIYDAAHQYLVENNFKRNGATGSRLINGNYTLYEEVESQLCQFHESEAALIFNSGYDANIGFFSSVPQRGDIILYDEFIHASIRDGITMSHAKAYKFKHNNLQDLKSSIMRHSAPKLQGFSASHDVIYVVTESVFSMDGDAPDLRSMSELCEHAQAFLIVDEAHAIGVFGKHGCGQIQSLDLQKKIFARIITFGKALGCHGAAILGSHELKQYLINFARSFIYTTGLPPHALATIKAAYNALVSLNNEQFKLQENIRSFKSEIVKQQLQQRFIASDSAIQSCIISGNRNVKEVARKLREQGFDTKAILSPTVSTGHERLRFCIHSYNSIKEIKEVVGLLRIFVA